MYELHDEDAVFSGLFHPAIQKGEVSREPMSEALLESASQDFGDTMLRNQAMSIALTFIESGDYTPAALQDLIQGFADLDENEELSEDEQSYYEQLAIAAVDAFVSLGGSTDNAQAAVNGDVIAAQKLGDYLSGKVADNPKSDSDLIASFAIEGGMVLEAVKKVVRDGVVTWVNVPTRKKILSPAQRAALRKARAKSNTAAAKAARKKAMRIREQRGM